MESLSFNKGMREIQAGVAPTVRKELMNALGIRCRQSFYLRRDGKIKSMSVTDKDVIERIFRAYNVTNPWGE